MEKQSIGKYISSIYRYQSILINRHFENYGICSGQYLFFISIAKSPGINQRDLSEMLRIDRANTHRAIRKLEASGFIYTMRDECDKRMLKSYLTEKGEELMPDIKAGLEELTDMLLEDFNEQEKGEIFVLLQKIEKNVQAAVQKARGEK